MSPITPHAGTPIKIFRIFFSHLTTTIAKVNIYLHKHPRDHDVELDFTEFKRLGDKVRKTYEPAKPRKKAVGEKFGKGKEKAKLEPAIVTCQKIEDYKGSAVAYLEGHGWSLDKFGLEYWTNCCFMENNALPFERNARIDGRRGQRLLVMSGLTWNCESHNKLRDYSNIIVAVTLETVIVESYRESLINECTGAAALRGELQRYFKTGVLPQLDQVTGQFEDDWEFPDKLSVIGDKAAPGTHRWDPTLLKKELNTVRDGSRGGAGGGGGASSKKKSRKNEASKDGGTAPEPESLDTIDNMVKVLEENIYLFCSDPGVAPGTMETVAYDLITRLYKVRLDLIYGWDGLQGLGLHWAHRDRHIEQGAHQS